MTMCSIGHRLVAFDDSPDETGRSRRCPVCEELERRCELDHDLARLERKMQVLTDKLDALKAADDANAAMTMDGIGERIV